MISKKKFVDTMNWLTDIDERMNAVNKTMQDLDKDFCGFYVNDFIEMIVDLVTDALSDNEQCWVAYFVYECDFLRNDGDNVFINHEPAKLTTWGQVYDFIIEQE